MNARDTRRNDGFGIRTVTSDIDAQIQQFERGKDVPVCRTLKMLARQEMWMQQKKPLCVLVSFAEGSRPSCNTLFFFVLHVMLKIATRLMARSLICRVQLPQKHTLYMKSFIEQTARTVTMMMGLAIGKE